MKTRYKVLPLTTRSALILTCSLTFITQSTSLTGAIAPTLNHPWVSGTGSSLLAGAIEWAANGFVFGETPESRNATLNASPSLRTTSGTKTSLTQVGQSASINSQSTTAEERYGRCNVTVEQIIWDSNLQQYHSVQQRNYYVDSFHTGMAQINTASQSGSQWTGAGYWVVYGTSEKVEGVGHRIESSVSGDTSLASQGTFTYTATLTYTLANQAYSGAWTWIPETIDRTLSKTLSATSNGSTSVSLLNSNTMLYNDSLSGGSQIRWKKVSATAFNVTVNTIPISIPAKFWIASQTTW